MSHAKILSTNDDDDVDEAIGKLENEIVHPHQFVCGCIEGVIWQYRNSVNFVFDLPNAIAEQELSKGRHLSSALARASPNEGNWEPWLEPESELVWLTYVVTQIGIVSFTYISGFKCQVLSPTCAPTHPIAHGTSRGRRYKFAFFNYRPTV